VSWLWRLLVPIKPFGLFLEGLIVWEWPERHLGPTSEPGQVGPNRSDPEHYTVDGRYRWWGC
jgi:hypothetical protein